MKADALMRFILSGSRSLEGYAILLARISLGVFFAISGGNKLFVASQYNLMYQTIAAAGIPFPHVMTAFVSSVELVCGCLLIVGLLSTLCCVAFIIDMIVALTTVQLATITKALSFIDSSAPATAAIAVGRGHSRWYDPDHQASFHPDGSPSRVLLPCRRAARRAEAGAPWLSSGLRSGCKASP